MIGADPQGKIFATSITARGSLDVSIVPLTADIIQGDALAIYKAGMDLISFMRKHKFGPKFPTELRSRAHKTKAARKKRRKEILGSK